MSREIKFRVWTGDRIINCGDNDTALWIDGDSWSFLSHFMGGGNELKAVAKRPSSDPVNSEDTGCALMQYTGLKDKNGTDIYEGDIIQLYRHDDREHRHIKARVWVNGVYKDDIKEVKFMFGSFVIWSDLIKDYRCFANLARPGESLEVIGNRFQNPELL